MNPVKVSIIFLCFYDRKYADQVRLADDDLFFYCLNRKCANNRKGS